MFETFNTPRQEIMAITSVQALKLARGAGRQSINTSLNGEGSQAADKGLTAVQAEKTLASLVSEGWFERSLEGWYTLSPRALMELKNWLVSAYNDPDDADADEWQRIKSCEACKSIVTWGQRCGGEDCTVRLHDVCEAAFWRTRRDKTCPKCETEWDGRHFVGERAITTTESYLRGKRRSGVNGSSRNQRAAPEEEMEEEEENTD